MKYKTNNIIFFFVSIAIVVFFSVELFLRKVWGFCDAPLCIENEKYEYIFAPNQDRYRFGCHIHYNSYSQRSEEPDSTRKRILGLGDSVINGGAHTDQDSLATSIFFKETGIQMLNISAGSWGPDNIAAYLKENGLFGASGIVVVLSSHDAHDIMDFRPVVGKSVAFPDKQYNSAIVELFDRYLIPRINKILGKSRDYFDPDVEANNNAAKLIKKDDGRGFNPGWNQLFEIAKEHNIPFVVYLHAEKIEVIEGEYGVQGHEILKWAQINDVLLYKGLDMGEKEDLYFDNIHLNDKGQRLLANNLIQITSNW